MAKYSYTFIALIILMMVGVNAQETSFYFKQNDNINYRFRCFNSNNTYCGSGTQLIISIEYPNGSNAMDNQSMTRTSTYYNTTLPTDAIGQYGAIITSPDNNGTVSEFTYIVSRTGNNFSTSEAIIYIIFMVALIFFLILSLIGSVKIPWSRQYKRDWEGKILDTRDLKHLKVILIVVSYILLMFFFGVTQSIMTNYLYLNGAGNVFNWAFWIMLGFLFPIIIVSLLFIIIYAIENKKTREAILRGVPIR